MNLKEKVYYVVSGTERMSRILYQRFIQDDNLLSTIITYSDSYYSPTVHLVGGRAVIFIPYEKSIELKETGGVQIISDADFEKRVWGGDDNGSSRETTKRTNGSDTGKKRKSACVKRRYPGNEKKSHKKGLGV